MLQGITAPIVLSQNAGDCKAVDELLSQGTEGSTSKGWVTELVPVSSSELGIAQCLLTLGTCHLQNLPTASATAAQAAVVPQQSCFRQVQHRFF